MVEIKLVRAETKDAETLASISKRAFDSDAEVGSLGPGGPPGYDSPSFQIKLMEWLDYYKILLDEKIVGGIFASSTGSFHRVLERIFIDPSYHRRGFASQAMKLLWKRYPDTQLWTLGTPEWNVRTGEFYEKLGFIQIGWENLGLNWRGIWYQKVMNPSKPIKMLTVGELKDGMKDITVEGVILAISPSRNVISKSTGKTLTVANVELSDDTGKIVLVLWNEQISEVKIDDKVRIEFGSVKSYQGVPQLSTGWSGRIIILL